MTSPQPRSKRKRTTRPLGNLLHPGEWKGKRARSGSRSGSPTDSGASTPGLSYQSDTLETPRGPANVPPIMDEEHDQPHTASGGAGNDTTLSPQIAAQQPQDRALGLSPPNHAGRAAWAGLGQALQALHISTKVCPPLHSAIDGLKSYLSIFEEAAKHREDYDELATGLTAMVKLLGRHLPDAASVEISDAITNIAEKIVEEIESIGKRHSHAGARRSLEALGNEDDLIRRYRKIEQLLRQLQGEASLSTWNISRKQLIDTQLEKLCPVKRARFDSEISTDIGRRSCTENTRTKIITDSLKWADDPAGAKIYWMNGMAGTGKTTIAYSLCEALVASGQLAASFFCTRSSSECREAKRIIPTIAYQLARRSAPFRHSLCGALNEDPDIGNRIPAMQFEHLLAKPLKKAKDNMANNLVIVIDALDECSDPHVVELVLGILFRFANDLPIKLFVTSRPEPVIRSSMMSGIAESDRPYPILYLHEIEKSLVQADIELYLKDELRSMLPDHCADIEELAKQAGNLFIYAATAVRHIRPSGRVVDPKQRLRAILNVSNQSNEGLNDIDVLYSAILTAAIQDETLHPEERSNILAVLWTAVCACEPVATDTIGVLSDLRERDQVVYALEPLRSVLHVSEHSNLVTTLHASFPDYMFSRDRSKQFFCDKSSHSQLLAASCLNIMKSQLRFNICQIQSSFIFDDEIPDLPERANANISPELFYACRYWVEHLSRVEIAGTLVPMVEEFLSYRLLFWMEVLNIRKCMVVGALASTMANMWLRTVHASSELIALAHDAQTFVGNYASRPVSSSTPHIYISALPLSSPISQIRLTYQPRFKGLVRSAGTLMEQIDRGSLAVWPERSIIRSASFSPDRKYIALGDENGHITIRDSQNGDPVSTFKAHKKAISSIAFSNDATLIVSGSYDHTLCIWTTNNGSRTAGPLKGHTNRVNSVVFSLDGMRFVSGAEDCTIRIWAITSGHSNCLLLITGPSPVKSVALSPNGANVVSGSNDHTVRIWDALDGALLHSFRGHTQAVTCVRFSPCGDFIVSGSNDRTIRIWDACNRTPVGNPLQGHFNRITSITVSPEGERIVSGSLDQTIRVWHKNSGELMAGPFVGHTDSVRSVEFSSDGARIISASDDKTIRVWNAQGATGCEAKDASGSGASPIVATAISPNGAYVASAHEDRSIRVWNIQNVSPEMMWTLQLVLDGRILLLAFSSDCACLFVMSSGTVLHALNVLAGEYFAAPRRFSLHSEISSRPLAISSDGRIAVSARKSTPTPIIDLWDLQADRQVCVITPIDSDHVNQIVDAAFSSSTTLLATGTRNGMINVWDGTSGQRNAGPFHFDRASELAGMGISPDGTLVASVHTGRAGNDLHVYNTTNGSHTVLSISFHRMKICDSHVKFSPNGEYLLLACQGEYGRWFLGLYNMADPGICRGRLVKNTALPPLFSLASSSISFITNNYCLISRHDVKRIEFKHLRIDGSDEVQTRSDDNGWLVGANSTRIIWIPQEIRDRFLKSTGSFICDQGSFGVDYGDMLLGDEWSHCYIGG